MNAAGLIAKKRDGGALEKEEIEFFVRGVTDGTIPDYQASAFLMAVCWRGMSFDETVALTRAMAGSGRRVDLSKVRSPKVDKHSTGGVGDGTSLVVAPVVAALGVAVPMISGRGLGHTGGTLDKLGAIPGFRTDLSEEEFEEQVERIGVALAGQTDQLAPADRKLYALRDVTGTIESIPLIAASILSKKVAEGCEALVLDVKFGAGAFLREKRDAQALALSLVRIGRRLGLRVAALLTGMEQPLGRAVGNALEAEQAVSVLKGTEEDGMRDFIEVCDLLAGWMVFLAGRAKSFRSGMGQAREARRSGRGLDKWREILLAQGGDVRCGSSPAECLPQAAHRKKVQSPWKGYVMRLDARAVGMAALRLGAGREKKEDPIDPSAGIRLLKKVGDPVERGEPLAELLASDPGRIVAAENLYLVGARIGNRRPKPQPLVAGRVR